MVDVYRASRKSEGKDGKIYWNQVGLTVFVGEYNGETRISIVDERSGQRYSCFPPYQDDKGRQRGGAAQGGERQTPDMHDDLDIPF